MSKSSSTIVAVGSTVDFGLLDDPAQTNAALVKAVEEVLSAIHTAAFDNHRACWKEDLPTLHSLLKDLYVSIDFLRTPTSKGVMPASTENFQIEVTTGYRALSTFLSFDRENLPFSDWNALVRTIARLEVALKGFVETFGDSPSGKK